MNRGFFELGEYIERPPPGTLLTTWTKLFHSNKWDSRLGYFGPTHTITADLFYLIRTAHDEATRTNMDRVTPSAIDQSPFSCDISSSGYRTSGLRRVAEQQSTLELMRTMIEAKGGRKKIFFHKYWRVNSGNNARSLLFLADSHDLNRSTVLDPEAHIRMLMSHPHPWPCRTKTHRTGECHLWPYLCGCIIFSPNPFLPCPLY